MADFPGGTPVRPVIASTSPEALGLSLRVVGNATAVVASGTWPGVNRALYVPFAVQGPFQIQRVWWANGVTASANIDCGIYTVGGTKLGSIGSTVQAGTNVVQSAALSLLLAPGSYYMALVLSALAGTIFRTNSPFVRHEQVMGMAQEALGSTALPAVATFATVGAGTVPLFGITSSSVI